MEILLRSRSVPSRDPPSSSFPTSATLYVLRWDFHIILTLNWAFFKQNIAKKCVIWLEKRSNLKLKCYIWCLWAIAVVVRSMQKHWSKVSPVPSLRFLGCRESPTKQRRRRRLRPRFPVRRKVQLVPNISECEEMQYFLKSGIHFYADFSVYTVLGCGYVTYCRFGHRTLCFALFWHRRHIPLVFMSYT